MNDIKILSKWYMKGALPVWHVKCSLCNREYRIMEHQKFICDCMKNDISLEGKDLNVLNIEAVTS